MSENTLLRKALLGNALFSVICGFSCLIFATPLAKVMGVGEAWILTGLGVGLLIFAADVAFTATRPHINPLFAKMIIGADISWVVGSVALLVFFSEYLSMTGQLLVELIAIAVAGFAVVQSVGLKQLSQPVELAV